MIFTVGDFGERRILAEIIPKYAQAVGDDCAVMTGLSDYVVVSTDPVPPPAAASLGGDNDPYWIGWLLVTINASDIAASGSRPAGFLAALDLPNDYPIAKLERLLKGIADSCCANGLVYVGGNLRESASVSAVGTAFGSSKLPPLQRKGASADDLLIVLGKGGQFWEDVEQLRTGARIDKSISPVFSPVSQARVVAQLHEAGLLRCAMDTSDGLAPTLVELARVNGLQAMVDLTTMIPRGVSLASRPERLWMGWGDWTVVAAAKAADWTKILLLVNENGGECTAIGHFVFGEPSVVVRGKTASAFLGRLESERFSHDSWFSLGIEEYRRRLHALELPE